MTSAQLRRYDGRTAFVTGGAHGIGRAIVERLAAEGASVAIADIDDEAAAEVAAGLGEQGLAVHCDVTDGESVRAAVAATVERFGGLGVVVNDAFTGKGASLEDLTDETWNSTMNGTLAGAVRAIQAAMPHLLAAPYGAAVVSIGSVNGLAAFGGLAYSAAKAGVYSITQNLAVMYGDKGVRFNVVAPGTIRTRVWENRGAGHAAFMDRVAERYPLKRIGEPADIAAAVAFLGSDDAAWVTGVVLPVDGGIMAGPLRLLFGDDPTR
ncbi:SDR family NAD(P)-dependent oxidoreductase [Fodinicola acaciae]|uniref:SDR family NAD(P)-dependent oxidoreductase n=1 Tax=Fodinicola acaciae TaxID=2681555 RepID=UPI0013CF4D91|nr:SDR family oxidoreductase [Fodinicola acaciae]